MREILLIVFAALFLSACAVLREIAPPDSGSFSPYKDAGEFFRTKDAQAGGTAQ